MKSDTLYIWRTREAAAAPAAAGIGLREDFAQVGIDEKSFEEKDGKRHLVVTLMREGPGNLRDMNFYHPEALESLVKLILERPKQYANHAADTASPDRDLRDWMSSVKEAWVESGPEGFAVAKAKVRVYDNWLWERAKQAPDELALSVEGRGAGKREKIGEQDYNGIYGLTALNGVHWVDYPGNAGMGVNVVESHRANGPQEDAPMDFKAITEEAKNASPEEKKALAEALGLKAQPDNAAVESLSRQVAEIKASSEAQSKALTEKVTALEQEKAKLANVVESHQLREVERGREKMVDDLLKASRLKEEHKTPTFRATLLSIREAKNGDKAVTEQEQMTQLIKDRESICLAEVADPNAAAGKRIEKSFNERAIAFSKKFFGVDTTEVYRDPALVGEENVLKS